MEDFLHIIDKRHDDRAKCRQDFDNLGQDVIEMVREDESADTTEVQSDLMLQLRIAAKHDTQISKIKQNVEKKAVTFWKEREVWVCQRYIERYDFRQEKVGLIDAKKQLREMIKIDQDPNVFASNRYTVNYGDNEQLVHVTSSSGRSKKLPTIRFKKKILSGVHKMRVLFIDHWADNDTPFFIGCVSVDVDDPLFLANDLTKIGFAHKISTRSHGKWYRLLVTIDMNKPKLRVGTLSRTLPNNSKDKSTETCIDLPKGAMHFAMSLDSNSEVVFCPHDLYDCY